MWGLLSLLGFLAFIIYIILAIIALVKKNGTAKKKMIIAGISFLVFIIAVINIPSAKTETASTSGQAIEKTANKESNGKQKEENTQKQTSSDHNKYADLTKSYMPVVTESNMTLPDQTYDFIVKNYKLFPAKSKADISEAKKITDSTIQYKQLNKNPAPFFQKMASFSGTVSTIEETVQDGETVTLIDINDDDMQSYEILLLKPAKNILEDDVIRFWGVPAGASSYSNVQGGSTNFQFFVGSHVENLQ
ncbi:hypothetical protein KY305_08290 [Bacillus sp. YC2]|uniref:hypothetical protein n=1 Tax=Bacillus sp. YC2 TaxID=2861287 RepID=UPI001CA6955E|nr:hypothetical protein [Bacillus sp. YC2]MBY8912741.1 hypothetical protein [Bacillus sp. YC2]